MKQKLKSLYSLAAIVAVGAASFFCGRPAQAEDAKGHSDYGMVISQTDDGPQAGFAWMTDRWEGFFTVDFSFTDAANNNSGDLTEDLGTTIRLGRRHATSENDYITYGAQYYQNWFGRDSAGNYETEHHGGPYFGFERQFPKTGVTLIAFVVPVGYDLVTDDGQQDANGNQMTTRTANIRFFQMGGFGMTYLF
jgi:hypothetical protein